MKYILVLLVIVVAIGIWRSRRRVERAQRRETRLQPPQDMVACAHCGLHLPRSEALVLEAPQPRYYCCVQHRAQGPA
ncbi:MAG: PP0621 family protein [Comamonas sp.]